MWAAVGMACLSGLVALQQQRGRNSTGALPIQTSLNFYYGESAESHLTCFSCDDKWLPIAQLRLVRLLS